MDTYCLTFHASIFTALFIMRAAGADATSPIGIFDSGIGGLTVLERLLEHPQLASERFTYLGDQANMPYGNYAAAGKASYLRELVIRDALFLVSDGAYSNGGEASPSRTKDPAKIIVIACNTATAYGRNAVESVFKSIGARQRVIGVIDAGVRSALARAASDDPSSGFAIGVMATPGTVASDAYPRTVRAECARRGMTAKVEVFSHASAGLADAIELGAADADAIASEGLRQLVAKYRASRSSLPLKAVILGCTHYPFVMPALERTRAELGMDFVFVDPAADTAEECYQALRAEGLLAPRKTEGRQDVTAYVSVPSRALPPACVASDGTLAAAYKYGRDPGRDEVTTKFVPLAAGTVDRSTLARLIKMLPRVRASGLDAPAAVQR